MRNGILSKINATLILNLLHLKRHEHSQRFCGQSTECIYASGTDRQRRIQSICLLILEHCHLAHLLTGQGQNLLGVCIKLFFRISGQHHSQHAHHHSLVTGSQIIQKLLAFLALLLHIIRNYS